MNKKKPFKEILKKAESNRLRWIAKLGRLGDLHPGEETPAYGKSEDGKSDILMGNPVIPGCFKKLKELIPDSDWWWLTSGYCSRSYKGSTADSGGFQFSFMVVDYFLVCAYYDPLAGFTKIKIGYDDVDTEIKEPLSVTVKDIEDFVSSDFESVVKFIVEKCRLNREQLKSTLNLMKRIRLRKC
jgi:hypothetical protein